MSNMDVNEPAGGAFSMLEHRTTGVLYYIFGITGLLGNFLIILIFLGKTPLGDARKNLHVHFAVGNMMVVACAPFSGASAFVGRWLFGDLGCQLYGAESYTGGMASVTFAFLLCAQRAMSMAYPDSYATSGAPGLLCILGWLYSVAIAIGPLIGWNSYVTESSGTACGLNWLTDDTSHRSMFIVLLVVNTAMLFLALISLKSAFGYKATAKPKGDDWFTDNQLNWIAVANLAISTIGFGPYGFFAAWTLASPSQMTMLASVIPPLSAKMSTMFYPIVYMIASKRFRDEFAARTIGIECDRKRN